MSTSNAIITSSFTLPSEVADGIWKKAQSESVLARLANAEPQKFGQTNVMTLSQPPVAELVGEGAAKSPTPAVYSSKTVTPLKLQVTMRFSDEVMWADEDYQLGILMDMRESAGIALGRALDIVGIHKMNPLTGLVSPGVPAGIADTSNSAQLVQAGYDEAIDTAAGLVIADGYTPSGIAMDPSFAFGIGTQRDGDGRRLYPEVGFGTNLGNFRGMSAAVGDTVSAKKEAASPTGILAILGEFSAFRWGVQRNIAAKLIESGDPDGQGDLNRTNQIAIRAEVVYGVGIMDTNAFAKIVGETGETGITGA